MDDFAEFERQVEEALMHMYDPAYHPPESLNLSLRLHLDLHLGLHALQPQEFIRDALTQAIEQLQPASDVPASARVRRIYDLLDLRYRQEKTQKETALRLGITVRHLRREQQLAIHLLAERLWEPPKAQPTVAQPSFHVITSRDSTQAEQDKTDWREQVRREIHVLQSNAPGLLANIQETLAAVLELAKALTPAITITLDVEPTLPVLWVATHPAVLREVLITAVDKLVASLQPAGTIHVSVVIHDEKVEIVLRGCPATLAQLPDSNFIDEVLDIYAGSFAVRQQQNGVEFRLALPLVQPVTVLVVDDNHDLVHFYRRYTEGTRYVIHHVAHGQQLWEKLNSHPAATPHSDAPDTLVPDIIVLDVMLPDIGGWDMLRQLRKHPLTQETPIIICSVIQQEELAKTLGATVYLSKPAHRNDFLRALDTASQSATLRQ
jgi:CheY-like chemotaxis protein